MAVTTVDDYIGQFSGEARLRLEIVRELVGNVAPEAEEGLMYGLVGYKLRKKPLVYFGGFKSHIGFYATPNAHEAFADELSKYKQDKGSVQFPLTEELPIDLIKRMVAHRKEVV